MQVVRIGLDLAKYVFEVHGVDSHGKVVVRKTLSRDVVARFFANLPLSGRHRSLEQSALLGKRAFRSRVIRFG